MSTGEGTGSAGNSGGCVVTSRSGVLPPPLRGVPAGTGTLSSHTLSLHLRGPVFCQF